MIAILRIESRCCTVSSYHAARRVPAPSGIAHAPGAGHSTLRPMSDPRCHHCGRRRARRCHRVGALERVLSAVYVYPFRCQVCGRRFRALAWGKRYVRRSADHRELERVAIRAPVVLRSGHVSAPGEATELSLDGFTAKTAARLGVGTSVSVTLDLWLVALAVVLVLVAWLRLFPWSG